MAKQRIPTVVISDLEIFFVKFIHFISLRSYTLYNVCSIHRGMFSTSGGIQYIGGYSVHRGDAMSTSGAYHEYIGEIS